MDDPDADMKSEVDVEGGVKYQDPLLVPTAVLLARREVASRYPQSTINHLHRVTEETLVYRKYSQTSCQLPGAPKSTFLMVFSPDGSKVASTHGDHNIYVSEVKTGQCICTLEGHPRTPWCVAFHPASNEIIASGCLGGEVRVWDLKGGSEVWTTEKDTVIASLAFHPTDQVLVIATFNEIYFWDWFQPEPFASISTGDEKEKVRYVKFDPLGHKLITGIANTVNDRLSQGSSRASGSNSGPTLSRLELVARELRLSHRYNQLSSRFRDLMSRYEALTSTALNNTTANRPASRVDRGTDPIDPPPATLGQQVLLNQARQFAQQVTEERRTSASNQEGSQAGGARVNSTWTSADAQNSRESQTTNDINLRLEEDYGLSAVRTLRQIISDDSASSSSLDSSSSATSGASGVSERNTRLSLLWTSRLQRSGQDSDSAGEASSVHSAGDANTPAGSGEARLPTVIREGTSNARTGEAVGRAGSSEQRNFRGSDRQASDDDDDLPSLDVNLLPTRAPQTERAGTMWGYYSSQGLIHTGRLRAAADPMNANNSRNNNNNNNNSRNTSNTTPASVGGPEGSQGSRAETNSEDAGNSQNSAGAVNRTSSDSVDRRSSSRCTFYLPRPSNRDSQGTSPSVRPRVPYDLDEDLAVPGPSGLSGLARYQSSLQSVIRYSNSSTIDPQFGVQLLSGHIENMQRICRAHLEITRHRHEIRRLQQIRSMLYDIQHQIHSLRASVDQSIEDLSGSLVDMSNTTNQRPRGVNEEDPAPAPTQGPNPATRSCAALRHWSRTSPRSVARLQRGPFGTRTRSRHSHSSLAVSPSVYRRIPRLRLARTRFHLPGLCTPVRGTNGPSEASGGRLSPSRGANDSLDHNPIAVAIDPIAAALGPLPTPPPDQRDAEQQPRDIVQTPSDESNPTQTRTMLQQSFEQLQERLRARQEALEQQERRLRGFLGTSASSAATGSPSAASPSLDGDEEPPSPPVRMRRSRPPTTSLSSRIANMIAHQSANASNNAPNSENSSQWYSTRRRLRQNIINARRDMVVGRTPCRAGGPVLFPVSRLRPRNVSAERIPVLIMEGLRRERRDRYRQILRHMADRLNSLVNQEQEQQDQQEQRQQQQRTSSDCPNSDQPNSGTSMDNHMENLRLLVRLALHLIDQLLNFICNQNISYEERPISRLPNPFRDEEMGVTGEGRRNDLSSSIDLDLSPGLHNLTTLFETVRMASEELRNDEGGGESSSAQESTRPITNVPRRLTDFLRRSGNLAQQQQNLSGENEDRDGRGARASSSRPQLVIPRITLRDPSGSESQVVDDSTAGANARPPLHSDRAEFSTRSVSGIPLRLLGRQYAVDRRSPDAEEYPVMPENNQDGAQHHPWRSPYDLLRGSAPDMLFRPNLNRAPPDRSSEREADNFFSRPYYASHPASRAMSASMVTHRIQAWDFTNYQIPDISDSIANMVVGKCKIHNDASVDVSADGTLLAALVPESQAMIMVGVYSLENRSLGQLLYSYIFAPNTICVSLSPVARHLVVGFCSQMPRLVTHHNTKQVVAQIYKLCDNPMFHGRGQAGHLQLMRDIEVVCDHRHTSLNCIRWLPYPGQGLIYGNNRGQLNILR